MAVLRRRRFGPGDGINAAPRPPGPSDTQSSRCPTAHGCPRRIPIRKLIPPSGPLRDSPVRINRVSWGTSGSHSLELVAGGDPFLLETQSEGMPWPSDQDFRDGAGFRGSFGPATIGRMRPGTDLDRIILYVPARILNVAEALAEKAGVTSIQDYCGLLLMQAIENERVRQRIAGFESRRGPLEGLKEIADDPDYLAEWQKRSGEKAEAPASRDRRCADFHRDFTCGRGLLSGAGDHFNRCTRRAREFRAG